MCLASTLLESRVSMTPQRNSGVVFDLYMLLWCKDGKSMKVYFSNIESFHIIKGYAVPPTTAPINNLLLNYVLNDKVPYNILMPITFSDFSVVIVCLCTTFYGF